MGTIQQRRGIKSTRVGDPVKTSRFHCRGMGSTPGKELRSHTPHGTTKKKSVRGRQSDQKAPLRKWYLRQDLQEVRENQVDI